MKKLFLILSFFISLISYGQTGNLTGNRVQANSNLLPPLDTILAPYRVGEMRTQVVGNTSYIFVCKSLSADKKWDVYTNSPATVINTRYSLTKGLGDSLQLVNDTLNVAKGQVYGVSLFDGTRQWVQAQEQAYGVLYNKNFWTNLSDFTNSGSTVSVVSNKLRFTSGGGTFTQSLNLPFYTMLEKWKISIGVTVDVKDANSFGFGVGTRSTNSYGLSNALGRFIASTGTGTGTVIINAGTTNTQAAQSDSALTYSAADRLVLTVERDRGKIIVSVKNSTTNSTITSQSYTYTTVAPFLPNTGQFAIYSFGGQFTVDSLAVSSNVNTNALLMTIGDSKTQLYNTVYGQRYSDYLNEKYRSTVVHAGGYDRTTDVLNALPEIISLRPKQVFMAIGSNDPRSGMDSTTTVTQYAAIVSALTAAKIKVWHSTLFYETGTNQQPLINFIRQTYSAADIIETYNAGIINPGFLSADGVHPTTFGNLVIYNTVADSYRIFGANTKYETAAAGINGTINYIPLFNSTNSIISSSISDDATTVTVRTPATRLQSNTPSISLYKSNNATDNKEWRQDVTSTTWALKAFADDGVTNSTAINSIRSGATITSTSVNAGNNAFLTNNTESDANKSLFLGNRVQGTIQQRIRWNTDGNLEFYSFGGIGNIFGFNNARTQGYPVQLAGSYTSIGHFGTSNSYIEDIKATTTGTGFGVGTPSATLHLKAGTATASTAPIKLTAGVLLTIPESGVLETNANNALYYSNSSGRGKVQVNTNTTSSAGTLALNDLYSYYTFTGTTSTWTLPSLASSVGMRFVLINSGSGTITLNSNSGGNDIWEGGVGTNTLAINSTEIYTLYNNSIAWVVMP